MIEVQVWNAANDTMLGVLSRRWAVQWQDDFNQAGIGSVTVHKSDPVATAGNLAYFNVVRFVYEGAVRFAFRIEQRTTVAVGASEAEQGYQLSGRGLLAILSDARLYPEYGLSRLSGSDRYFNFASIEGDWYDAADWNAPVGVRQDSTTTPLRSGKNTPSNWPDPAAQWIWATDPEADAPDGEINWFRGEFTLSSDTDVRIYVSGDDYYTVYLDGQVVITSPEDVAAWRNYDTHEVDQLAAGTHLIGVQCQNRTYPGTNPAAILVAVAELDSSGEPSAILFRTNETAWVVATTATGWQPHHILDQIVTEAQSRSVEGPSNITLGFTSATDSGSVTWSTPITERSFRVGEDCYSVATTLVEDSDMDIWLDPATMTLEAYQVRGTDLSTGSTLVALRPAESVTSMTITGERPSSTRLILGTEDGWFEESDSSAESAFGRVEGWAELGGVYTADEASRQGQNMLGYLAADAVDATVTHTDKAGPKPYVDYNVGDTILAPSGWTPGAYAAYRVMGFTVTENDDGTLTITDDLDGS